MMVLTGMHQVLITILMDGKMFVVFMITTIHMYFELRKEYIIRRFICLQFKF